MAIEKRIVTHSELQSIKDCPTKWNYAYNIGLKPNRYSWALIEGQASHTALEFYYKGAAISQCETEIRNKVQEYFLLSNAQSSEYDVYEKCAEKIINIFHNYLAFWHGNDFKVVKIDGNPLVETQFKIPIYTPSGRASRLFEFAGKVDLVIEDSAGDWWINDHKSKATITGNFDRLVIDQQQKSYCFAMSRYLDHPIQGTVYNMIRRAIPDTPKINKNGEVSAAKCNTTRDVFIDTLLNQDAYLESLTDDQRKEMKLKSCINFCKYADEIIRLKDNKFFDRHYQRYSDQDMMDIQMELYQSAMLIHYIKYPYKNDAACDHWGGCSYRPLCMGKDAAGLFQKRDRHQELEKVVYQEVQSGGFDVSKLQNTPKTVGFDAMLDTVQ